jgi:hypothetical protein
LLDKLENEPEGRQAGLAMITWVLIASAVIVLVLVVLVQGKWTSWDSWFAAVFALAMMAMVIGPYVIRIDVPPPSPPAEKATARQDQTGQASANDGAGNGGRRAVTDAFAKQQ